MLITEDFHSLFGITTLTANIHSYRIAADYNRMSSEKDSMSGRDSSNEGNSFIEFRRKVRAAEVLSAAMENLLKSLRFSGRVSVVVQNGRVLKSGYEEGYFRQGASDGRLEPGVAIEP